jgi:hypothetical protein
VLLEAPFALGFARSADPHIQIIVTLRRWYQHEACCLPHADHVGSHADELDQAA